MTLTATFDALSAADIVAFIANAQEEHLQLDFKTVTGPALNSRDDRRNLAVAMSGFANSSGGLVVWGVVARRNEAGIDCATEPSLISPVQQFVSRLNEFAGQALSPPADGVRHKALVTEGGAGYAVTLVPESESTPHMAKLGEDRYYKRSGSSFYVMEHFDLEDMFGRRQKPRLQIRATHTAVPENPALIDLIFRLLNTGRAVAKYAGFLARFENATVDHVTESIENLSAINEGRAVVSHGQDIGVIHASGIPVRVGRVRLSRHDLNADIIAHITSYCEHTRTETNTISFPPYPVPALPPT